MESRRMRWAVNVEGMGRDKEHTVLWWRNPTDRLHMDGVRVNGRSKWTLQEECGGDLIGLIWLRTGKSGCLFLVSWRFT
jgi:hypothetical protein